MVECSALNKTFMLFPPMLRKRIEEDPERMRGFGDERRLLNAIFWVIRSHINHKLNNYT